jgi:ABC-type bacteriocin/lantibiotic exporter with double-glycine peptidase domain
MAKYPLIKQYDEKDCAPAVLLSVLKFYGGNSSLPHLRELCNTNLQGSTMLDLVNASKSLGFKAIGASGEYEDLMKEKTPVIAHVVIDGALNHFVVVYKIKDNKIFIADPSKGKYWLSKDEFLKIWKRKAVVLLEPEKELLKKQAPLWYNWIFSYIKKEEGWIYQSLFLGTIYTILGLTTALFIQLLLDKFIPEKEISKIILSGGFLISILLIKSIAGFFRQRFLIILNRNVNTNINSDFLQHLFKLPKKFFDTRKIGEITARINDAIRIQSAVLQVVGVSLIDVFVIIASFGLMFYFSLMLAWLSLAIIPIYALILLLSIKKIKNEQNEVMKGYALVESTYFDSLKGVDEIISFGTSNSYSAKNRIFFSNYQEKVKTLGFTQANLSLIAELLGSLIIVGLLVSGALWVVEGKLLIGEMIAAYSLLANIIPAVNRFVNTNIVLQETSIASTRLMDMLLIDEEVSEGKSKFKMSSALSIKNGSFSWNGRKYLFDGINMRIEKGKITSLWGSSGVGKSTIVQILQRKYQLDSGNVLIDEIDVSEIDLAKYRDEIGVVPQAIKIFNGTIAENILLGREISDINIIEKRIAELGLLPFYQRFKYGFATIIGEDGREISGGEQQLISITRALLNKPKILIIDEGLSGIDIELEKIILDVLKKYSKENSVLLISHNLNSIMKTDFVYVLANGTISQQGKPQELILKKGYFKQMWKLRESMYKSKTNFLV